MAGLSLDQGWRDRSYTDHAASAVVSAWCGDPLESRAAMAAATGDVVRAAAIAGGPFQCLAQGDLAGALRQSRDADDRQSMALALVEAEALLAAGAVASGIERLTDLHRALYPAATVALTRHRHRLGDHQGAADVAMALPGHAQAALTGAKSAILARRAGAAVRLLEPFLNGVAPIPDALVAGALVTVAASALARLGRWDDIERLASGLLETPDLADPMTPALARVAWTAGRASAAWERFQPELGPWGVVGRLELSILAGDLELATRLSIQAGELGAPARAVLKLLNGGERQAAEAGGPFAAGRRVHLWRTHPHRWAPWIAAAQSGSAEIELFDLAAGEVPEVGDLPDVALDDSALLDLVEPVAVPARPMRGSGVWVEAGLCAGIGIGHDWPPAEDAALGERLQGNRAEAPEAARVWVVSGDTAMAFAGSGHPMLAIAPPGDPFWAGPLPGRAWPAVRVLRPDPRRGWEGAGLRAAEAALALASGARGNDAGEEH